MPGQRLLCFHYTRSHAECQALLLAFKAGFQGVDDAPVSYTHLVVYKRQTLHNGDTSLAILDMSAACHTPDVIEMPYRPPLLDAGEAGEKACTVRLGGPTCLAGDIVGDYSFDAPLTEGDKLIFGDMAIYTTCKNNTFNGMPLPPIWLLGADGSCRELVHFGYQDFKMRLGAI